MVIGLVILAVVIVLAAVLIAGRDRTPPSPPVPPPPPGPTQSAPDAAREAVVTYMQHLQHGEYAEAHALLSKESRERHPLDKFQRQAEQSVTFYDLSSARVKLTKPGRAEVTLRQEEDPASATVIAVREDDAWRVVYLGGRPSQPYP